MKRSLLLFEAFRYKGQPKVVRGVLFVLLALAWMGSAGCANSEERKRENIAGARALSQQYQAALKKELMSAMGAGGPVAAISVCHLEAPKIADRLADAHSKKGFTLGRTSDRVRSPKNAPNDWQKRGLAEIERRLAVGESPAKVEVYDEADGRFRYLSPIMTGDLCVTCHGAKEAIPAPLLDQIEALYPEDRATGFSVGELRGAFVVTGPAIR
jgi:hypothetical protein